MSNVFYLKYRDTRPILQVALKNPDGTAHDLTGSTGWKLHVKRPDGTVVTRTMTKVGADVDGVLSYTWLTADWDDVTGLVAGPALPLKPSNVEHTMEYEVVGPATARMTFPNDGYDILRIFSDIGQG